jgi:hypothetical protein
MNLKKIGLGLVLLDFSAFTVWVAINGGGLGEILPAFTANPWVLQVAVDLVLALSLFCLWMWNDARRRGKNPVPWLVATLCTGSIAPLAYLLLRPDEDA